MPGFPRVGSKPVSTRNWPVVGRSPPFCRCFGHYAVSSMPTRAFILPRAKKVKEKKKAEQIIGKTHVSPSKALHGAQVDEIYEKPRTVTVNRKLFDDKEVFKEVERKEEKSVSNNEDVRSKVLYKKWVDSQENSVTEESHYDDLDSQVTKQSFGLTKFHEDYEFRRDKWMRNVEIEDPYFDRTTKTFQFPKAPTVLNESYHSSPKLNRVSGNIKHRVDDFIEHDYTGHLVSEDQHLFDDEAAEKFWNMNPFIEKITNRANVIMEEERVKTEKLIGKNTYHVSLFR